MCNAASVGACGRLHVRDVFDKLLRMDDLVSCAAEVSVRLENLESPSPCPRMAWTMALVSAVSTVRLAREWLTSVCHAEERL